MYGYIAEEGSSYIGWETLEHYTADINRIMRGLGCGAPSADPESEYVYTFGADVTGDFYAGLRAECEDEYRRAMGHADEDEEEENVWDRLFNTDAYCLCA